MVFQIILHPNFRNRRNKSVILMPVVCSLFPVQINPNRNFGPIQQRDVGFHSLATVSITKQFPAARNCCSLRESNANQFLI
jgi:hypothetical protein